LLTLCDPQTSGGLLVCVDQTYASEFENFTKGKGLFLKPIGQLQEKVDVTINIV